MKIDSLSKDKILDSYQELFLNPNILKITSLENTYSTYDKGLLCVNVNEIKFLNHHGFPYRRFDLTVEKI